MGLREPLLARSEGKRKGVSTIRVSGWDQEGSASLDPIR